AVILLQLGLKATEERERICRGSGKAGKDFVLIQPANLARVVLDYAFAQCDLSIGSHHHFAVPANAKHSGRADFRCVSGERTRKLIHANIEIITTQCRQDPPRGSAHNACLHLKFFVLAAQLAFHHPVPRSGRRRMRERRETTSRGECDRGCCRCSAKLARRVRARTRWKASVRACTPRRRTRPNGPRSQAASRVRSAARSKRRCAPTDMDGAGRSESVQAASNSRP